MRPKGWRPIGDSEKKYDSDQCFVMRLKRLGFVQYHIIQDITIGLGVISL
jgi:hypothetical protein